MDNRRTYRKLMWFIPNVGNFRNKLQCGSFLHSQKRHDCDAINAQKFGSVSLLLVQTKKKKRIHLVLDCLAFTVSVLTPTLKIEINTKNDFYDVYIWDGIHQKTKTMLFTGLNVLCVYIWWYFHQLRTREELRKCVKVSKQWQGFLRYTHKWRSAARRQCFWQLYQTVMGNIVGNNFTVVILWHYIRFWFV